MRICESLLITIIGRDHCCSAITRAAFTGVVKGSQWQKTARKVNSEKLWMRICNYNMLGNERNLRSGRVEGWEDRKEGGRKNE